MHRRLLRNNRCHIHVPRPPNGPNALGLIEILQRKSVSPIFAEHQFHLAIYFGHFVDQTNQPRIFNQSGFLRLGEASVSFHSNLINRKWTNSNSYQIDITSIRHHSLAFNYTGCCAAFCPHANISSSLFEYRPWSTWGTEKGSRSHHKCGSTEKGFCMENTFHLEHI